MQEWLYMDGEDGTATEFQERLNSLKAIGDPIFFRLKEVTERPAAVGHARNYLDQLQKIVQDWESKKSWLPREKIDEVLKEADNLKIWLDEKETEQKTAGFSKPAFTSGEVYTKVFNLQDKVATVNRIPRPKPKIEKPTENKSESKGSSDAASEEAPSADEQSTQATDGTPDEQSTHATDGTAEEKAEQESVDEPESKLHDEL